MDYKAEKEIQNYQLPAFSFLLNCMQRNVKFYVKTNTLKILTFKEDKTREGYLFALPKDTVYDSL